MLDAKSLELLSSLKTDIKATKDILNGKIKGTGRTFGFVVSEQGDEYFLPPDEMSKVFPGDEVTFTVTEQSDGKSRAELESLEKSNFKEFNGVFYARGKGQGVEPFNDAFSGWLFVPPKQVNNANNNDIVVAKVTRHPWKTGKAQAEVSSIIGSADNNRSWYSMSLKEHNIAESFTDEEINAAQTAIDTGLPEQASRVDLTHLPFVTIDSKTTQDMDDAIYAAPAESGWTLYVAIADASAYVTPDSILDKAAQQRLCTTYLPGLILPMLPETLGNDTLSLAENVNRAALVFTLSINPDGQVSDFHTQLATVKNHAKLNYSDVSQWLSDNAIPEAYKETLLTLAAVTKAMAEKRQLTSTPMPNHIDYRIRVDDEFNVTEIDKEYKNAARDIVEQAMVATNFQVAKWLKDEPALFMTHAGFRADRETELKGLLRDYAATVADLNGHELVDFRQIMKTAATVEGFPLVTVLQKRFDRGQWAVNAAGHFGLGMEFYTNATSPIRKYADLVVHRIIKAKIASEATVNTADLVATLNERGHASRNVANAIENRLRLKWLANEPKQNWDATIVHLNANGLIVRLTDNGATGFVDLRKMKNDFSYDPLRMLLKFEDRDYHLGLPLQVQISKVDQDSLTLAIN